jgi:hypothetical protein
MGGDPSLPKTKAAPRGRRRSPQNRLLEDAGACPLPKAQKDQSRSLFLIALLIPPTASGTQFAGREISVQFPFSRILPDIDYLRPMMEHEEKGLVIWV